MRQPPCAIPLRQTRQRYAQSRRKPCAIVRQRCAIPPPYTSYRRAQPFKAAAHVRNDMSGSNHGVSGETSPAMSRLLTRELPHETFA